MASTGTNFDPAMQDAPPVLRLDAVTLGARVGGRDVSALRDISLSIRSGQVLGVVGESGAGKSMLTKLIAGLLPEGFGVRSGAMEFCGESLLAMSAAQRRELLGRRIAFVPQEPLTALDPVWTLGATFREHLSRLGVPARERDGMAIRYLEAVQLPTPAKLLERYPHQLSGGQCQRVLIAMAFANQPALLIADEPTTALDVVTQARVMTLLGEMQRSQDTAVLLITHDLRLAAQVCDQIAVMYAGDLVETGPAAEVLETPRHPYTRALKHATPDLRGERRRLPSLPRQMPGLTALPDLPGCRFAPRCALADAPCAAGRHWRVNASGHGVACSEHCESGADASDKVQAPPPGMAEPGSRPIVELREASLAYRSTTGFFKPEHHAFHAVKSLSLKIYPGEFVGIVGESGSGKTSVARLVMGIESPTEGRLLIDGEDISYGNAEMLRRARERVQIIFQDPQSALNPRSQVERLLTQAMEAVGLPALGAAQRRERAESLHRDVGLPQDCLGKFPSQLSGGQKQRVNIGRALGASPALIVADEIVSGLDVSVQAQILNLLLDLRAQRTIALLLISHDLSVVRYLCHRVLVMQRGEVVEQGETETVFANPQHPYTRELIAAVPGNHAEAS
ncbi:MAG TPA: ABC transporter ATP-binding protein [Bordetella sp.]